MGRRRDRRRHAGHAGPDARPGRVAPDPGAGRLPVRAGRGADPRRPAHPRPGARGRADGRTAPGADARPQPRRAQPAGRRRRPVRPRPGRAAGGARPAARRRAARHLPALADRPLVTRADALETIDELCRASAGAAASADRRLPTGCRRAASSRRRCSGECRPDRKPQGLGPAPSWPSSASAWCRRCGRRRTRSTICWPGWRAATSRPARAGRRRAAWPTSCRRAATSTPSIRGPCRRRRPGRSARSWPAKSWSATARETGAYPETVGISVWGTSAMRTHGDDVAEVLALLGVRPVWQKENRRVVGVEVIPLDGAGPAADRRDGAHQRLLPRRLSASDQAARRGGAGGRAAATSRRSRTSSASTTSPTWRPTSPPALPERASGRRATASSAPSPAATARACCR